MIRQLVEELELEGSPDSVRALAVIAQGTTAGATDALMWLIAQGFGQAWESGETVRGRIERLSDDEIAHHLKARADL